MRSDCKSTKKNGKPNTDTVLCAIYIRTSCSVGYTDAFTVPFGERLSLDLMVSSRCEAMLVPTQSLQMDPSTTANNI